MSVDFPPPTPTPPSIESAVREHLDVVAEVKRLGAEVTKIGREMHNLRADIGRPVDAATVAKALLVKLGKHLGVNLDV